MKFTFAVDTGNRAMKTTSAVFAASYREAGHLPALGADVLIFCNKEYHLEVQTSKLYYSKRTC